MIHPRRQDIHTKRILLGRTEPQLRRAPVDLRTHVHGRARLVGRDELGVERDGGLDGGQEQVDGHGRDRDEGRRVLEARGVAVGAEDGDAVVARQAEGFEAFVGLLAVVEGGGHAVQADVGVGDEGRGGPDAGVDGVVRFDVAVYWGEAGSARWMVFGERGGRAYLRGRGSPRWTSQSC